jgi:Zn-dependent M28 family amino/carboxypeptidase
MAMIHKPTTTDRLKSHVSTLTRTIGERSVYKRENLQQAAEYVMGVFTDIGLSVRQEPFRFRDFTVSNVVAQLGDPQQARHRYLIGAHYDTVQGTVGADDNASAVAVLLETARELTRFCGQPGFEILLTFAAFTLEEPPAYGTSAMGSRIYARNARLRQEALDGMICLEMVGYTCHFPGCQKYPFPLMFLNYPDKGNFIAIVGNWSSRRLTRSLTDAFAKNPDLPVVSLTVPLGGWLMPSVRLSDHGSFWDEGYRAVMITDSAFFRNPHYHMRTDTMDTLDFGFMTELVENLVRFINGINPQQ